MESRVFSAKRNSLQFEFGFSDGSMGMFTYLAPTTKMIDAGIALAESKPSASEALGRRVAVLRECLQGNDVDRLINDLTENGNIYEFAAELEAALAEASAKK